MRHSNAAKLDALQVAQVRSLLRCGFTQRSIAAAFGTCPHTIYNLREGRHYVGIADDVTTDLPALSPAVAPRLRLRGEKRLPAEQKKRLEAYRRRLALQIDDEAEREGYALSLASNWRPRRPGSGPRTKRFGKRQRDTQMHEKSPT